MASPEGFNSVNDMSDEGIGEESGFQSLSDEVPFSGDLDREEKLEENKNLSEVERTELENEVSAKIKGSEVLKRIVIAAAIVVSLTTAGVYGGSTALKRRAQSDTERNSVSVTELDDVSAKSVAEGNVSAEDAIIPKDAENSTRKQINEDISENVGVAKASFEENAPAGAEDMEREQQEKQHEESGEVSWQEFVENESFSNHDHGKNKLSKQDQEELDEMIRQLEENIKKYQNERQ